MVYFCDCWNKSPKTSKEKLKIRSCCGGAAWAATSKTKRHFFLNMLYSLFIWLTSCQHVSCNVGVNKQTRLRSYKNAAAQVKNKNWSDGGRGGLSPLLWTRGQITGIQTYKKHKRVFSFTGLIHLNIHVHSHCKKKKTGRYWHHAVVV